MVLTYHCKITYIKHRPPSSFDDEIDRFRSHCTMISQILSLLLASAALPVEAASHRPKYNEPAPKLKLPWGTWEGKPYGEDGEVNATIIAPICIKQQ